MSLSSQAERFSKVRLSDFVPISTICLDFFPGCYALFDEQGDVLYVGHSKDVPARLKRHRRERKWWSKVDESKTVVYQLAGQSDRLRLEGFLQLLYHPRHCRAIKLSLNNDGSLTELQFLRGKR